MVELDETVVRRAATGDSRAFKAFYDHYAPFVWRVTFQAASGDASRAAQITQDVFVRAMKSLARFDFRSTVSTWLYRIAWNRAMSALEADRNWRKRLEELARAQDGIVRASDPVETRDTLLKLLTGVDVQDRFLLVAREVDGIAFEELSQLTGVSAGALRVRLTRIKQSLRERMADEHE